MNANTTPVLVAGGRTPIGRLGGRLSHLPAVELGAIAARAALARAGEPRPDYVAMGHVLQAGNGQVEVRDEAGAPDARRDPGDGRSRDNPD